MFRNYLKIAIRTLLKQKGYTFINISGLAIGVACAMLALLYLQDELTFDAFHKKANRIYRIIEDQGDQQIASTAGALAQTLMANIPEVANTVRLLPDRFTVANGQKRFVEQDQLLVDASFLEVFDFELIVGDRNKALKMPNSVVLTEASAKKYFEAENPIGKSLTTDKFGEVHVTGILRDLPRNSHLDFSMLFPYPGNAFWSSWEADEVITYIVLKPGHSAVELEAKLPDLIKDSSAVAAYDSRRLYLQPLPDVHFYSSHIQFDRNTNKGEIYYLYIFSAIGLFILLIACMNYMNMAIARSMGRAKEIGLRKVIGARRGQLVGQFFSESVLLSLLALLVAVGLIEIFLPAFNTLAGKELSLSFDANGVTVLTGLALLVGIISGSFPALYLSKVRSAQALKGFVKTGQSGARLFRRSLVVTQFVISIMMLIATVVVYSQLNYIRNKRLGYKPEQLVVIKTGYDGHGNVKFKAMKNEFAKSAAVGSVSASSRIPGDEMYGITLQVRPEGTSVTDIVILQSFRIDEDFLTTYQIELTQGRNFIEGQTSNASAVLINETAAKMLGWDPSIGKQIRAATAAFGEYELNVNFEGQVIGVVRDFHFRSLHEKIAPMVLRYVGPERVQYFTANISGQQIPTTIEYMRGVHEQFETHAPFEYHFMDDQLNDYYQADQQIGRIFSIAAALAILLACLGLFSLAAFTAEQRTKEIGVRKVLGATVEHIVTLLAKDFVKLVLLANLIAWPLAWLAMNRWLQDFAYRIDIGPWVFALAGGLALVIALLAVSTQAIRAALANPVEALRYE